MLPLQKGFGEIFLLRAGLTIIVAGTDNKPGNVYREFVHFFIHQSHPFDTQYEIIHMELIRIEKVDVLYDDNKGCKLACTTHLFTF